jgi:HAD superfamily phosphoserine phosphatase-like hydrolase
MKFCLCLRLQGNVFNLILTMKNIEAVVFDIDGTLSPVNSWTAFSEGIGASVDKHLEIYKHHTKGEISYKESVTQLVGLWQATGKANMQFVHGLYESWEIKPEVYPLIDWLKENDYMTCLITGSVTDYAKHVAEKLGVDDYYASAEFYYDENGNFANFDYVLDQAPEKILHLKEFCQKRSIEPEQCIAVGDSWNDLELFKQTGNGLLIGDTDNEELIKAAYKRIPDLSVIKNILET